jgi:16S rRNA (guanine(527)-N(7))-methyltransferase RsmG
VERDADRSTWNTHPDPDEPWQQMTERAPEARELLAAGFDELSLNVAESQLESLWKLAQLLEKWSKRVNLTGHRTLDQIVRRLILDAAALVAELPEIPTLADIGAGAGFPGFPIAILRPECQVALVESRRRPHHFQREVIRQLGLGNASAVLGRAETHEPISCAAAIGQAVSRPSDLLPLLMPWVAAGGLLLFPGGAEPATVPGDERVRFVSCVRYRVPCGGPDRTLWIARRATAN